MNVPLYDPKLTYEENFKSGPFGEFADENVDDLNFSSMEKFLGFDVNLPFGIPAGPLLNGRFVKAAFRRGYSLPVYKTVRSKAKEVNGFPNVVPVEVGGDLTLEKAENGLVVADDFSFPLAITNSFGVPSMDPDWWQPDMADAVKSAGKGQVMIASFQGTNRGNGVDDFIADHVLTARLVKETGAKIMEMNLSCPNEGKAKLLCHDTNLVVVIADKVKNEIGDIPLLLKMSYFPYDDILEDFVVKLAPIVEGFSVINTIAGKIFDKEGRAALGADRPVSGVCGSPIKWAGLDMVRRMNEMRNRLNLDFSIVGVGGVTSKEDYVEYRNVGADAVMSATGVMWNPYLIRDVVNVK